MLPLDEVVRANPAYVESLYRDWQCDPASVDERWALFFAGYDLARSGTGGPSGAPAVAQPAHPPALASRGARLRRGRSRSGRGLGAVPRRRPRPAPRARRGARRDLL